MRCTLCVCRVPYLHHYAPLDCERCRHLRTLGTLGSSGDAEVAFTFTMLAVFGGFHQIERAALAQDFEHGNYTNSAREGCLVSLGESIRHRRLPTRCARLKAIEF